MSTVESEAGVIAYANTQPVLLSLLYDLDLMPEQVTGEDRTLMLRIISVYMLGVLTERQACEKLARGFVPSSAVEDGYGTICDEIAVAIHARK